MQAIARIKTSISLPSDLLAEIDATHKNRSAFFEQAIRNELERSRRQRHYAQELHLLSQAAANASASSTSDQPDLDDPGWEVA
jgi:metal-responsive CopG/Arc/MetJ family transcriptional regulator